MEKLRLTKAEKAVLLELAGHPIIAAIAAVAALFVSCIRLMAATLH